MGDKLEKDYLILCLSVLVMALLGTASVFLIIEKHNSSYKLVPISGNTVKFSEDKVKVSYDDGSSEPIRIIIKSNNPEETQNIINSKGGSSRKIGRVISANIPQNELNSLSSEDSISEVLPNREVKAFSISVSETNADKFWTQGYTGKNVKIAVLDTGINSDKVISSQDFTDSGNTDDENGHGTKVAEIISAMAPDAELINVKVLDKNGFGSEASVIEGIDYAISQNVDIISLSLGGLFTDIDSPLVSAVEDAVDKGITVVVASGNCGVRGLCGDFVGVATPGNSPNAITVGSVDGNDAVPYSSGFNFGNYIKPDVVAPVSANSLTGTSASTPFVSGAAALIIEKYKANPLKVKSLIEGNAVDLGESGKDIVFGSGRLNLDFIDENVEENKISFLSNPRPIQNNIIQAFGTTSAGEWHVSNSPHFLYKAKSEFLNPTFGFIFTKSDIKTFDGTNVVTSYSNAENPWWCFETGSTVKDIKILSTTDAYLVSLDRIKHFTGSSWNIESLPGHKNSTSCGGPTGGYDLVAVDFNSGTGFAAGTNYTGSGVVLKKTGTWNVENFNFVPIQDIKFVNSTLAFAIGSIVNGANVNQTIYKWNGASWSVDFNIASSARGRLNEIEVVSNNLAYAVGDKGTITKWTGGSWSDDVSSNQFNLYDVSFINSTLGYAVGENSTILKYTGSWNILNQGTRLVSSVECVENGTATGEIADLVNTTLSDVHAFSPSSGVMFGLGSAVCTGDASGPSDGTLLRLEPTAPYLNVPKLTVEQNISLVTDLNLFSDGTSYSLNSGSCVLSGGTNNILLFSDTSTTGLKTCRITATKNSLTATQTIQIEVYPTGPLSDLDVEKEDLNVIQSGSNSDVSVTVHNIGKISASSVGVKLIEMNNNKVVQETTNIIASIANGTSGLVSFNSFNPQKGNTLVAIADYGNSITEISESNNRAETIYKRMNVYLNVTVQSQFTNTIKDYLQSTLNYNIVANEADANMTMNVAYNAGDRIKGCNLGTVYYGGKAVSDVHSGLIFSNNKVINVCGARIEGLLNAVKRLNKEDISKNKETFFDRTDLGAISVRDFLNGKPLNPDLVKEALDGPFTSSQDYVTASDGTYLRLKHYKPIVSQSFIDYLFSVDNSRPWLSPVIMAGGLWSDITAWDEAGKEISVGMEDSYLSDSIKYAPRDVWLIELTGGPNTDCDTCNDYTYDDVVDKYWTASVGGVLRLTGKSSAAYVGHSNGGRVALDGLKNWSASGKLNAGTLSNGTSYNLPSNPIDNYIGVGVPGAFSSGSPFSDCMKKYGEKVAENMVNKGLSHISSTELRNQLLIESTKAGDAICTSLEFGLAGEEKISTNLVNKYYYLINSSSDQQPGSGLGLTKGTIISGSFDLSPQYDSDAVVPISDEKNIATNIFGTLSSHYYEYFLTHTALEIGGVPFGLTNGKSSKTKIKEVLNNG